MGINKRSQGHAHTCRAQWDGSYDWSGRIQSLERKAGDIRKRCCPLYQRPAGVHGVPSGVDEELTESLWIKIKGKAGTGDIYSVL